MEIERGIFGVPIFRYIIEKLIYNDEYTNIDKNLDGSNMGARKNRNIRDNIFVLNSVIGPAGQQTYRAYVLNIPTATTTATTTTTTAIFPNLKTKIVIT